MEGTAQRGSAIGERVKAARERLAWSREELAVNSKLSWSAIYQVEAGRRSNLRPATLVALAGALGVSVDYLVSGGMPAHTMLNHRALVYEGEEGFAAEVAPFVLEGLERSEPVVVITGDRNRARLRKRLGDDSRRVELADAADWPSSVAEFLAAYARYLRDRLADGAAWVRVVGEPVWEGRSRSEVRAWIRFEAMVNLLFAQAPASILCPYDRTSVPPSVLRQMYLTHPETIESGAVQESPEYADPGAFLLGDG